MTKYPGDLVGPQFDQGDLVGFSVKQAEISFRLPAEHLKRREYNFVATAGHFDSLEPKWETDDMGGQSLLLADQAWIVEDQRTTHDVARYDIRVALVRLTKEHQMKGALANPEVLEAWSRVLLLALGEDGKEVSALGFSRMERNGVYWSRFEWSLIDGDAPSPFVVVPINSESIMTLSINMTSFYYEGWTNRYSKEQLKELESTLFNAFLDNLHVEYAPELRTVVEQDLETQQ